MPEVIVTTPESGADAPVVVEPVKAVVTIDPNALPSDDVVETPVVADPPEFVMPEKFAGKTAEEIAKSYMELEKARGTTPAAVTPPAGTDPKIAVPADVQAAVDVVAAAGLKYDDLSAQYTEKGELDAKSYDALKAKGIPKAMVDGFIAGQIALGEKTATATAAAAHTAAGDAKAYGEMVEWAAKGGLNKPAITAFNKAIDSNDPATITMAVQGVMAAKAKAGATEPVNLDPGSKGSGSSVYNSNAEVMKDMSDPRYDKDPAFRARVEAKVGRSNNVL